MRRLGSFQRNRAWRAIPSASAMPLSRGQTPRAFQSLLRAVNFSFVSPMNCFSSPALTWSLVLRGVENPACLWHCLVKCISFLPALDLHLIFRVLRALLMLRKSRGFRTRPSKYKYLTTLHILSGSRCSGKHPFWFSIRSRTVPTSSLPMWPFAGSWIIRSWRPHGSWWERSHTQRRSEGAIKNASKFPWYAIWLSS